jgi:hypothetical protein
MMKGPWQDEGSVDHALPRLRHWLTAAALILGVSLLVPIFAAFV